MTIPQSMAYWLAGCLLIVMGYGPHHAHAQLTPDDSLGSEASQVTPNAIVNGRPTDLIEGGAVRGANLFHSFSEFNVENRAQVYFANPAGVDTILTRVTGGNQSFINGTLGVDGAANLYLLNPNGVVFGRNARLDVDGAFAVSTADVWNLDDGGVFSASNPNGPPLLTVSLTPGLQYSAAQQGDVINAGTLTVNANQDLTLRGETVVNRGTLGGNVILRADADVRFEGFAFSFFSQLNSLIAIAGEQMRINAPLDATSGSINLTADVMSISSSIEAAVDINGTANRINISGLIFGFPTFISTVGGNINLTATDQIMVNRNSSIRTDNGGNIDLTADQITVTENSSVITNNGGNITVLVLEELQLTQAGKLQTTASGANNGGTIDIQTQSISLDGNFLGIPSAISTLLERNGSGQAGSIIIDTNTLSITNGASISALNATSNSLGRGGSIDITASNVYIDGVGDITATPSSVQTLSTSAGSTGELNLSTDELTIINGGRILTFSEGSGDSGVINIRSSQAMLDGNSSGIGSGTTGSGNSGDVIVIADDLSVTNGANILTLNQQGIGRSGDIYIVASYIFLEGVSEPPTIGSAVGSSGGGGNLIIVADEILIANGAIIEAETRGLGTAGDISVEASRIVVDGENIAADRSSAINTTVVNDAGGDGGDLLITVGELIVLDGAFVATRSAGQGNSGDVTIIATRVALDGASRRAGQQPSRIESLVDDEGDGGNIALTTEELSLTNTGAIRTTNTGSGRSGELRVTATDSATLDQGSIVSGTFSQSDSGDIILNAQRLTLQNGSTIGANAAPTGDVGDANPVAGTIDVVANAVTLDRSAIATEGTLGGGGNVFVVADSYLLLRNGSRITTNAGTQFAGGDGGNIDIRAPFVAAVLSENSDITANAFSGSGGRVTVTARDIIGLEFQDQLTPNSDITASSTTGADGVTEFNRLTNVDVQEGLSNLPIDLADPSGLINRSCELQSSANASEFSVTGRGGLPSNPTNALDENALVEDLGPTPTHQVNPANPPNGFAANSLDGVPAAIVEPQSWQQQADGSIYLYATAATSGTPPLDTNCATVADSPQSSLQPLP